MKYKVINAPEAIWLNYGDGPEDEVTDHRVCDDVGWTSGCAATDTNVQYVRADLHEVALAQSLAEAEAAKQSLAEMTSTAAEYESCIIDQGLQVESLTAELEKLRGMVPRWIPVSEGLPELWTPVLATYYPFNNPSNGAQVHRAQLTGIGDWVSVSDDSEKKIVYTPLHWMAIPLPPSPTNQSHQAATQDPAPGVGEKWYCTNQAGCLCEESGDNMLECPWIRHPASTEQP